MKSIFIHGILLVCTLGLYGQQPPDCCRMTRDTIMLKDVIVSCTIPLNNKQIEKFYKTDYFSTIDNLIGHLDGISLIKRGAYAMEPQLNGFSGGQLNVTIDGMKMFGACTDKMDPITSYLEPVNLKGITLAHGTNGSTHGNNTGGSIDMSLMEPPSAGTFPSGSSLSLGYESVSGSRNILLSTGSSGNHWAWGLNGVYRKNGLYRDGHGEKVEFSQFEKGNVHAVLKYSHDTASTWKADVLYDLALNTGYPALPMDVSRARAGLFALEYKRARLRYDMKAKVYYNSVYHVMDDSKRDSLFRLDDHNSNTPDSVIMRMDMPGWSNTFGSYFLVNLYLNPKNRLSLKADNYIHTSLAEMTMHMRFPGQSPEPPMYLQTWPDMLTTVSGLYISNTTRFSRKLLFTLNGRVDFAYDRFRSPVAREQFSVFNFDVKNSYGKFTKGVNLSAAYQILRPLMLQIQAGLSERVPSTSERFGFYLYNAYDGYDYVGNPFLKNEKSFSSRIDLTWVSQGLKINLSQSLNYLRDFILGLTDTSIPPMNFYTNGLRVYQNIPGAFLHSTDVQILFQPGDGFTLFDLARHSYGKIRSGAPLPLIPPLKNVISLFYEKNRWSFQVENETAFRQKRINSGYGEKETPSYTLFNLKTSVHFMLEKSMFDCSAGMTNIFNTFYHEHLDWGGIPRPGRSLNILLKYSF